jgi:murein DD-endopeptidase MepM/ murein hydrolase activator NlpD
MARGGVPGRVVRAFAVRRRGITALALGLVAYALPAQAEPRSGHAPPAPSRGGAIPPEVGRLDVSLESGRTFYGAARPMRATFVLSGDQRRRVSVAVVRASDGVAVRAWDEGVLAPGVRHTVEWDGTTGDRIQPEGRYVARVTASPDGRAPVVAGKAAFVFLRHRFPVRGVHAYGDAGARFGAGRGGGGHQGQDVFAACGTPLVAARGGVVQYQGFQGRAGNYLVIDGAATGVDYVYAHLRDPARFRAGRHVSTGQLIGFVGRTGDATACHLHFEMWSGPGWYAGGAPFDPRPLLRAWDRVSAG